MTTEIANTQGGALTSVKTGESLMTGYDSKDLIVPRAMLLQFTPPKTVEVPDFRAGRIIDNLTLEDLPKVFVPIFVRTKWIRFNASETTKPGYDPNFEIQAKIWESDNPLDPRVQKEGQWGPNGEPPLATKFLEFFCMFEGLEMPVLLSFAKTSLIAGQQLLSLARFSGSQMYSNRYELGAKMDINKQQQKFYVYTVKRLGAVSEQEAALFGSLYESFAKNASAIKVHGEEKDVNAEPVGEGRPY